MAFSDLYDNLCTPISVILRVHLPTKTKPSSIATKLPLLKIHPCLTTTIAESVSQSSLHGCKCNRFFFFFFFFVVNRAYDTDISACWTNQEKYFILEVSNLAPILSSFPAEKTCLMRVLFLSRIEPLDRNIFTYLKIVFAFETCASGKFRLNLRQHRHP
jgi:hypothetical protein